MKKSAKERQRLYNEVSKRARCRVLSKAKKRKVSSKNKKVFFV